MSIRNAQRLYALTALREGRGLTLTEMAQYCGMNSVRGRESVGRWEQGLSVPHARRRPKVLDYLQQGLQLDPAKLAEVWEILVEEWEWEPLALHEIMPVPPAVAASRQPKVQTHTSGQRDKHFALSAVEPRWAAPFQAPPKPPYFVGREAEMTRLQRRLTQMPDHVIIGFCGLGGVGKTTIALHLAHTWRNRFADGVLWAQLDSTTPDIILQNFGAAFGQAERVGEAPDLPARAALVRQILADKQVLVVLDNAETTPALHHLIPSGPRNVTLVTTRNRKLLSAVGALMVDIRPFNAANSLALLRMLLGEERIAGEFDAADQVSDLVGGLPLALSIVAGYLMESQELTLHDYAELLHDEQHRLQRLADWDDRARDVTASFELSYQRLPPPVQQLFAALAVFAGADFGVDAVAAIVQRPLTQLKLDLGRLHALSLLTLRQTPDDDDEAETLPRRYRLHPLLKTFARQKLGDQTYRMYERAATYFATLAQQHGVDNYPPLDAEWENVVGALRWAWQQRAWRQVLTGVHGLTYSNLGVVGFMDARGYWQQARELLSWGLQAARALDDHHAHAEMRTKQAAFAFRQGDLPEAKRYLGEAAKLLDKSPLTQETVGHWALFYEFAYRCTLIEDSVTALQKLEEGIARLQQVATDKMQAALGQLLILSSSGWGRQGRIDEAIAAIKHGLALLPAKPSIAKIGGLQNLGSAYFSRGNYAAAQQHYEDAFALAQQLQSARHLAMLTRNLGAIYKRLGKFQQAIAQYEQAAANYQMMADVEGEGFAHSNLGNCYICLGKDDEAFTHLFFALQLAVKHEHKDLQGAVLVNLAHLHLLQEEYLKANEYLNEAAALCQVIGSPDLAEVFALQAQLTLACHEDPQHALDLLQQAEQAHPDSLMQGVIERVRGSAFSALGQRALAEAAFQRSLHHFSPQEPYPRAQTQLAWARHDIVAAVQDRRLIDSLLLEAQTTFTTLDAQREVSLLQRLLSN